MSTCVVAVSKSSAFPPAIDRTPEVVLIEKCPASLPAVIEYVMALPSRSLSVAVWLSLMSTIVVPEAAYSATEGLALAIDGALISVLPTLTWIVAVSVLVPSVPRMVREWDVAVPKSSDLPAAIVIQPEAPLIAKIASALPLVML